jgi:hypothetical protein
VSNLIYLGVVVLLSVLGSLVLYLRNRQPKSMESGIEQFARELKALAPEQDVARRERRSG